MTVMTTMMVMYLSGNISVRPAVSVDEVGIDVVTPRKWKRVERVQLDPGVVVSDHIGVSVLVLILRSTGRFPRELLAGVY